MTYRDSVRRQAREALQKCQLAYDCLFYILNSAHQCNNSVVIKYDILNKLSTYRNFLKKYPQAAILDYVETSIFEECILQAEELTAEMESYNQYFFGEKSWIEQYKSLNGMLYFAPYQPLYYTADFSQHPIKDYKVEVNLFSDIILLPGKSK